MIPERSKVSGLICYIAVLSAWGASGGIAHAENFVVNSTADVVDFSPGDGYCETGFGNLVCTLRAAIQETNALAAATGEDSTVFVRPGTYTLIIAGAGEDAAATGDLDILGDLTLVGAGQTSTIVNAAGLDRVFDIIPTYGDGEALITTMTITGGNVTGNGGGIQNNGLLQLRAVTMSGNTATGNGGAVQDREELRVSASTFDGNRSISGNGGAIEANFAQRLEIVTSEFTNNRAGRNGGAVAASAVFNPPIVEETKFSGNQAGTFTVGHGGGMIARCPTVDRSAFLNNRASGFGGGLFNIGGCPGEIVNSVFARNTAVSVGGGIAHTGQLSLTHSTVVLNKGSKGGGIYGGPGLVPTIAFVANSVIALNTPNDCPGFAIDSLGNNLDSDRTCQFNESLDIRGANPQLDADFVPLLLSPLVDKGALIAGVDVDFRGFARPQDGNLDGVAVPDIGAFEFRPVK